MKKNTVLVVALIALMTGVLSAQTYDSESDFEVTKTGNAVTITKYVGNKTTVNIPPSIQNTPVTTIGANAFKSNTTITSVTIPDSVKTIMSGSFFGCTKLTSVTIGKGITSIERYAFNGCSSLTSVTFQGEINAGVFDTLAFDISIGDIRNTFYATRFAIGYPGTYTRPNSGSTTWTKQAAAQPTATPTQSGDSESDFKVTKTATAVTITGYAGTKTVVNIPPRIQNLPVTSIGDSAFWQNTGITSITIPNGVTSIGEGAFEDCYKLTSITIPSSVTTIGKRAFMMCNSLKSVTIPNSVKSIGELAFDSCSGLTSITIPNGVTSIGKDAFHYTLLTSVTFGGTIPSAGFHADAFRGLGDIRAKFYAANATNGTAGTYTTTEPAVKTSVWTKK